MCNEKRTTKKINISIAKWYFKNLSATFSITDRKIENIF